MNSIRLTLFFSICCFAQLGRLHGQVVKKLADIEVLAKGSVEVAYNANVKISAYDTVQKKPVQGVFSGVVVSSEGHILTAGHAMQPDMKYQITFIDGRQVLASGQGRIAFTNDTAGFDIGMLKIAEKGSWPFAKMKRRSALVTDQIALSMSFPGSFSYSRPNIRLGRLTELRSKKGYIKSSCKMEPGDSGGGLFDEQGNLIGIHSWIEKSEDSNYEIPLDWYLDNWQPLQLAADYKNLPEKSVAYPVEHLPVSPVIFPFVEKQDHSIVSVTSDKAGTAQHILGTVFIYQRAGKKRQLVVSKNSMVGDNIRILAAKDKAEAHVIRRDSVNDLVLLELGHKLKGIVPVDLQKTAMASGAETPGVLLETAFPEQQAIISILSNRSQQVPLRFSVGYFGANARFIDKKVTITDVAKGSGAEGILQLKDQLIGVNNVPIEKPADFNKEVNSFTVGELVLLKVVREGEIKELKMKIGGYPSPTHIADLFEGGRSERSDNFNKVLIHDAAVKADQCGSAVYGQDGRLYGINISRFSRTSTLIMPIEIVLHFIESAV